MRKPSGTGPSAIQPAAPSSPAGNAPQGLATRQAAVDLVHAVLTERRALDETLARHTAAGGLGRLSPRDRAHARLITATTLRRLGQIDAALATLLAKGLPADSGRLAPILQTAAAQLMFLDAPPHAVVSLAVTLAKACPKARRYEKLVNAVLRRLGEQAPALVAGQDAARLDTPDWLWHSWTATYGEDTARKIAVSHLTEAALDITPKSEPERWARELGAELLATGTLRRAVEGRIEDLPGYGGGHWWVQDCAAALPVRLLGDVRGRRILDLCAAPGGKTAQLAAAGALVTALDVSKPRLDRLAANLARLRLEAELVVADATTWSPSAPSEPFDAVLLDAPCTATGTIRRHPDIPRIKRPADIPRMAELQRRLLAKAADLVAPGGTLVFCTCSLQPEEGPERVAELLSARTDFERAPIVPAELAGQSAWLTPAGDLRTLPCHAVPGAAPPGGLDGFYAARLIRRSVGPVSVA